MAKSLKLGPAATASFGATMIGTAVRFLIQLLLDSWLGGVGYGIFVQARAWGEMMAKLADRGYAMGSVRFIPRYRAASEWGKYRGILSRAISGTVKTSVLLFGISLVAVVVFDLYPDKRNELITGLSLAIAISLASILRAALQGSNAYVGSVLIIELGQPALMLAGFAGLYYLDRLTIVSALLVALIAWFGVSFLQALLLRERTPYEVGENPPEFETEKWTQSTRSLFVAQLGIGVINISDVLVVGLTVGDLEAGIYALATRIAAIGRLANAAIESIVSPDIAAAANEGEAGIPKIQAIIDRAIKLSIGPSFLFAALSAFAAIPIIKFVLNKDLSAGSTVLIILVLSNLADAVSGPSGHAVSLVGSERNYAFIMVANAIALVIFSIPAGLMFGMVGVAVVRTAIGFSWNAALFHVARTKLGLWCLPRFRNV